jgi:hypothetical protein
MTCSFLARSAGVSVQTDRSLPTDVDDFVLNFLAVTPKFLPISGGSSVIHSSRFITSDDWSGTSYAITESLFYMTQQLLIQSSQAMFCW